MGKSYRYDPSGDDGFVDRNAMKRARKAEKSLRRQNNPDQIPAEVDTAEEPFVVMSTIDPWID